MARIRTAIVTRYSTVAVSASGHFKYPVGRDGAILLGYSQKILAGMSDAQLSAFCGVGNPLAIEPVAEGCIILDIGCGGGFDVYVAARTTGPRGRVYGVDLSSDMVARAQRNLADLQVQNAEVQLVSSEILPFADATFDVVISNGVINLSPDKNKMFREIFRVIKTGGRLQFADIVLAKKLPEHLVADVLSWSN